MSGPHPGIEIIVDEVVLRGVPREQAEAVAHSLEARLAVLGEEWAESGLSLSSRTDAARRAAAVEAPAGSPAALGDVLAGAVWTTAVSGGRP